MAEENKNYEVGTQQIHVQESLTPVHTIWIV